MMTIDSFLICILFCFYEYCRKSKHETPTKVSSEKVRAALQSQNAPQDRKPSLSGIGNSSSSKVMTASLEKPDRKPILIGKLVTDFLREFIPVVLFGIYWLYWITSATSAINFFDILKMIIFLSPPRSPSPVRRRQSLTLFDIFNDEVNESTMVFYKYLVVKTIIYFQLCLFCRAQKTWIWKENDILYFKFIFKGSKPN